MEEIVIYTHGKSLWDIWEIGVPMVSDWFHFHEFHWFFLIMFGQYSLGENDSWRISTTLINEEKKM